MFNMYNPQMTKDRIDNQIAQLQQMKEQLPPIQQPSINQTFQLANNQVGIKFVDTIDDVNKEMVFSDTPFFSKDMSVLWIKNAKNEIKTYSLEEIVQKDEKDIYISTLEQQIEELRKGMNNNEKCSSNNDTKSIKESKSSGLSNTNKSK